jgi:hypothetical protein
MVYLNWLWTPGWAWPHDAPILFLLICVIALTSLFSFLGLWGLALRFRRRSEQTDKEIASLHDEILLLKIRVNGLVRRRKRKREQKPSVLQFPDKVWGG